MGNTKIRVLGGLILFVCSCLFANQGPTQKLILVGGGVAPEEAYQYFVKAAGGDAGHFVMVTWSTTDPEGGYAAFQRRLKPYLANLDNVDVSPTLAQMEDADTAKNFQEKVLDQATGIFFSGGYQDLAMRVLLKYSKIRDTIRDRYKDGQLAAMGTSAGMAIMSNPMIDADLTDPKRFWTDEGLGLLPGVVVDQHFFKRQRESRLTQVLLDSKLAAGIGVDEDSAAIIEDNHLLRVVGDKGNDPNVLILRQSALAKSSELASASPSPASITEASSRKDEGEQPKEVATTEVTAVASPATMQRHELWPGDTWDLAVAP